MEDVNRYFNIDEFVDKEVNNRDIISNPYTPAQIQLYWDLRDAIKRHYQYLHEVEEMQTANPSIWYLRIKRFMDISVAILGMLLLLPLFLIVALLIKLDSHGPVFYGQMRVGENGKLFKMYKFRTMLADAEKKTGPVWAVANDPRITPIGKILRITKIDELPQLVNLIKGEMSMVGPRPERPFFVNQFTKIIPGYSRRLDITPGLTGIAQLRNGYDTGALSVIKKLRYDITYIKRMSLSMDLGLLAETFISVFKGKI